MAEQDGGASPSRWLDEWRKYSWLVFPSVRTPLRLGDGVSVLLTPWLDQRDRLGTFMEPRYRGSYELPITLINERLTGTTAAELETVLSTIRSLQGLDEFEGLAYFTHVFILVVDAYGYQRGQPSILHGMTYGEWAATGQDERARLEQVNRPRCTVEQMLKVWHRIGGRIASGYARSPDGTSGRPSYLTLPPSWLSLDRLKKLQALTEHPTNVPLLVDPSYISVTESFHRLYVETSRAGGSLSFAITPAVAVKKAPSPLPRATLRKTGKVWTISYAGTTIQLRDSKGLAYIATLLRSPKREIDVLALVAAIEGQVTSPTGRQIAELVSEQLDEQGLRIYTTDDMGPLLDDQTKVEYRSKLLELGEELEEAQAFGNSDRVGEIKEEMDMIIQQLKEASGLGGRARPVGRRDQQARVNVTKQIRNAEKQIGKYIPDLARHFGASIKTGRRCSYNAIEETDWDL